MVPPPIQLFLTTIASQPALRQRQEYILRSLQVKKIPYTSFDLASDEAAKRLWKRRAPQDKQQLPGILVDGKFVGTFTQFEEAVEFNELAIFLRQNEKWTPPEDDTQALVVKPIGVPGAYEPLQMFPKHAPSRSPSPNPMSLREKEKKELDVSNQLGEFGLEGVSVSADDLRALIEELGLGGDDAKDLVKGLGGDLPENKPQPSEPLKETAPDDKPEAKPTKQQAQTEAVADDKSEPAKVVQQETKTGEKVEESEDVKPAPEIKVQSEDAEVEPKEDAKEKGSKTEVTEASTTETITPEVTTTGAITTEVTTTAVTPTATTETTATTEEKSA